MYSKTFHWAREGRYCCTKYMAIVPFWFSVGHLWIVIAPFWLSTDGILSCVHITSAFERFMYIRKEGMFESFYNHSVSQLHLKFCRSPPLFAPHLTSLSHFARVIWYPWIQRMCFMCLSMGQVVRMHCILFAFLMLEEHDPQIYNVRTWDGWSNLDYEFPKPKMKCLCTFY